MEHNPQLTPYARDLRNNMTPQERKLWYEYLRKYPIQFRRQITVERYILDFYCAQAKLAVEIDGAQYYESKGKQHDLCRTNYLNSVGIEVLRFTNSDVEEKFLGVCITIGNRVKDRIS